MLKRYIDFINESKLDSVQQLPTDINYIKDITYELVEYFNDEFYNVDPISNVQYGILGYISTLNYITIPEHDANCNISSLNKLASTLYSISNISDHFQGYGWYMKFSTEDMWLSDDGYGNLSKGTLSDARYNILKKIKLKAKDAGYIMKIFHRRSEAGEDFKYLLFVNADSLIDYYNKNKEPVYSKND